MTVPPGLRLSPPVRALPLSECMLKDLGWTGLEARTEFSAEALVQILDELASEDCGHSWRSHLAEIREGSAAEQAIQLMQRAQAWRPTVLFLYIAHVQGGGTEVIALATISDRVHQDFRHSGFPVLARCFIRPAFRGRGLYPFLVRHRVELCKGHWGEGLSAIHMGATSPEIRRELTCQLDPGFVHMGDELLRVAGRDYRVEDLIAPMVGFRTRLLDSLPRATPAQQEFARSAEAFLSNGVTALSHCELLEQWSALDCEAPLPLQQLFDLFDAIGLIR